MYQHPDSEGLFERYLEALQRETQALDALRQHSNYEAIVDSMLETLGIRAEVALQILFTASAEDSFRHLRGVILNAVDGTGRQGMFLAQRLLASLPRNRLAAAVKGLLPSLIAELEPELLGRLLTDLLVLGLGDSARTVATHLEQLGELTEQGHLVLEDPTKHPRWLSSVDDIL